MSHQKQCPNCASYRTIVRGRFYNKFQGYGLLFFAIIFLYGTFALSTGFVIFGVPLLLWSMWFLYKAYYKDMAKAWCRHCNYRFSYSEA